MAKKRGAPVRVVRPLHLSVELNRTLVRAAAAADESVVGFIRTAAEERARVVLGRPQPDAAA